MARRESGTLRRVRASIRLQVTIGYVLCVVSPRATRSSLRVMAAKRESGTLRRVRASIRLQVDRVVCSASFCPKGDKIVTASQAHSESERYGWVRAYAYRSRICGELSSFARRATRSSLRVKMAQRGSERCDGACEHTLTVTMGW